MSKQPQNLNLMKTKFFITIFLGTWIHFNTLAGQMPVSPASPVAAPAKVPVVKNPAISGNLQNRGVGTMSVGGPAKAMKGTGAITGAAGAHKR